MFKSKAVRNMSVALCVACVGLSSLYNPAAVYAQEQATVTSNGTAASAEMEASAEATAIQESLAYENAVKTFEDMMNAALAEKRYDSASAAVIENGEVIYSKGFGIVDDVNDEPATGDTVFGIGSISKVYTAAAIIKLEQDGRLSLSDPVTRYIPEFKMADQRYKGITVGMLINHTSGLPSDVAMSSALNAGTASEVDHYDDVIAKLQNESLKSQPGKYASYSNDGFVLAQKVVENVSQKSFEQYLSTTFFNPMKLGNTGVFGVTDFTARNDSNGDKIYTAHRFNSLDKPMPMEVPSHGMIGAGGIAASAVDTGMFINKLLSPETGILDADSIETLRRNAAAATVPGENSLLTGYGFDFTTQTMYEEQVLSKNGGTAQYTSQVYTVPDTGITVAVLAAGNTTVPSPVFETAAQLTNDILAEKYAGTRSQEETAEEAEAPNNLQHFSGIYAVMQGGAYQFTVQGNKLLISSFVNGSWESAGEAVYREDGTFDGFSFFEKDGEQFVTVNGGADFMKLKAGTANKAWNGLDGTVWLAKDTERNDYFLPTYNTIKIHKLSGIEGYVALEFPEGSVIQKTTGDTEAVNASEINSGYGTLRMENGVLNLSGTDYVRAEDVPALPDNNIRLEEDNKAQWYKVPSDRQVTVSAGSNNARVIAADLDGAVINDSLYKAGTVTFPKGGYIMVSGVKGTELNVTERIDD